MYLYGKRSNFGGENRRRSRQAKHAIPRRRLQLISGRKSNQRRERAGNRWPASREVSVVAAPQPNPPLSPLPLISTYYCHSITALPYSWALFARWSPFCPRESEDFGTPLTGWRLWTPRTSPWWLDGGRRTLWCPKDRVISELRSFFRLCGFRLTPEEKQLQVRAGPAASHRSQVWTLPLSP